MKIDTVRDPYSFEAADHRRPGRRVEGDGRWAEDNEVSHAQLVPLFTDDLRHQIAVIVER